MIVSLLSGSTAARKVGSSRTKRPSALLMLSCDLLSTGLTDSEITGAGTCIELIATSIDSSVNVSPEAQSMPNIATMSPANASSSSSISAACMRPSRPTLWRRFVRLFTMLLPRPIRPWYTRR